jgi:hypothetical protein
MIKDLFEMTSEEHDKWLREQGVEVLDLSQPNEENLCRLVSIALRANDKDARVRALVDVANVSLALADKAMDAQDIVAKCLVLQRH